MKSVDPKIVGKELQKARKHQGLTQSEVAEILSVARTTITAIEKGDRNITFDELHKLAEIYSREVSDLVRARPEVPDFTTLFRSPGSKVDSDLHSIEKYLREVEDLARDFIELEALMEKRSTHSYPPVYSSASKDEFELATAVAKKERIRLSLGEGSIRNLRNILENQVGLRVFSLPLPSKYAGFFFFTPELGGCIAINSGHPPERRLQSLAHEYAHFLFHRTTPEVLPTSPPSNPASAEILAEAFGSFFLLPDDTLKKKMEEIKQNGSNLSMADILSLANFYGLSVEHLFLRLEQQKQIPKGYWNSIKRDIKIRDLQVQLGLDITDTNNDLLPLQFKLLAVDAYKQGLISEGRLKNFLRVSRLNARRIVESLGKQF